MSKGFTDQDRLRLGDRDGWICGICRDPARPVHKPLIAVELTFDLLEPETILPGDPDWALELVEEPEPWRPPYDPLAPHVDHIVPRSHGGTDDDSNLQISHARCNLLKHDDAQPSSEYARAVLNLTLHRTPIPFRVFHREFPRRPLPPAWKLERGEVAIEPWRLVLRFRAWRMVRRQHRLAALRKRPAPREHAAQRGWLGQVYSDGSVTPTGKERRGRRAPEAGPARPAGPVHRSASARPHLPGQDEIRCACPACSSARNAELRVLHDRLRALLHDRERKVSG